MDLCTKKKIWVGDYILLEGLKTGMGGYFSKASQTKHTEALASVRRQKYERVYYIEHVLVAVDGLGP